MAWNDLIWTVWDSQLLFVLSRPDMTRNTSVGFVDIFGVAFVAPWGTGLGLGCFVNSLGFVEDASAAEVLEEISGGVASDLGLCVRPVILRLG